jgi:ParB family chromosome partitioning protein
MSPSDNPLGRSLDYVFAKTARREAPKGYLEVDLGLIVPSPDNPRREYDQQALEELAASIRTHGILQPLVVLKKEVGYELVSGERRWRASQMAGLTKVPVVIRDENDPCHVAELRLIENIQRENLNPLELAKAYQALVDTHGLTHEALADRLNKERSSVTNIMRLLALPDPVQRLVADSALSLGHAKVLLGIADTARQGELARQAVTEEWSVRELEKAAKAGQATTAKGGKSKAPHLKELESNLGLLFNSRVQVTERGGKGAITLHFDDRDHYQRIVAIMAKFVSQATKS